MQTLMCRWNSSTGWSWLGALAAEPQLVLYFGAPAALAGGAPAVRELVARFPQAVVCGCSTAGEILGNHVFDDSIVAALISFRTTKVRGVVEAINPEMDSRLLGRRLANQLNAPELRHVLVFSDGLAVNGTALVAGFRDTLLPGVAITGGLAADGSNFQKTYVGLGGQVLPHQVVAVGFYGPDFLVSYGSRGGWEAFGPRRRITRSAGNTLFELDGQPALALYKRYLGTRAAGLPATGLLFPLELVKDVTAPEGVVRTILRLDEPQQSLTFAGDMPSGGYVRLMKASAEQLVEGAAQAGELAGANFHASDVPLALLVSCVGRRLVLGQRIEEELDAVIRSLPSAMPAIGFYSYGEACPAPRRLGSELHNQTMTITVLGESA